MKVKALLRALAEVREEAARLKDEALMGACDEYEKVIARAKASPTPENRLLVLQLGQAVSEMALARSRVKRGALMKPR